MSLLSNVVATAFQHDQVNVVNINTTHVRVNSIASNPNNNLLVGAVSDPDKTVGTSNILIGNNTQVSYMEPKVSNSIGVGTNTLVHRSGQIVLARDTENTNTYNSLILGLAPGDGSNTLIPGSYESDAEAGAVGVPLGGVYFYNDGDNNYLAIRLQ